MKPVSLFEPGIYSPEWIKDFYTQAGIWWGVDPHAPGVRQTRVEIVERLCGAGSKKILELGAGSGVTAAVLADAVQLASRYFEADVIGVCSAANLESLKSLGASQVIDYTRQDLTQSGETYDVVFDAVGKLGLVQGKKVLKPCGVYINVHADSDGGDKLENLLLLKELIEAGKIKPVIDRVYPLEQIVEAHRYVETGHKKGSVVIKMN